MCRKIKTVYECEDCHNSFSSGTEGTMCHAAIQFGGYGKCLLEEKPITDYKRKGRCPKCQERQERERKRQEREERERRRREVAEAVSRNIGSCRRAEEHARRERNDPNRYLDVWETED